MPAALLLTLLLAKLLAAGPRPFDGLPDSLIAYVWEDALVALLFLGFSAAIRLRALIAAAYSVVIAYTAINIPVAWALGSPLSSAMMRGASPTLGASFAHYLTLPAIGAIAGVSVAAFSLPRVQALHSRRASVIIVLLALVTLPLGPASARRIETTGRHQNALLSFARSLRDRVPAPPADRIENIRDLRIVPREGERLSAPFQPSATDLTSLRSAARGRDILLVVLESTGAEYLRTYGATEDTMPNLHSIAGKSLVFSEAYCVIPESIRNLDALLTSMAPAADTTPSPSNSISLPAMLRESGYRSALFHSGRFAYLDMDKVIENADLDLAEDAGDIGGERNSSFGVDDPSSVHRALEYLENVPAEQPVFLAWLPISGHHPYDSPGGPFEDEEDIDRYRNALHHADACFQQLLDGFRERRREPLIIAIGDHGEAFGQHEGNYGHTMFLYQENVRVPLIISVPEIDVAGRIDRTVSVLDIAPTILELIDADPPPEWEGRSMLSPASHAAPILTDMGPLRLALVDDRWKLIYEPERESIRLFDLSSDPTERLDLAHRYPERSAAVAAALLRWCAPERRER